MKITYLPYMGPPKDHNHQKYRGFNPEPEVEVKPKKHEVQCPHCKKIGVRFAMKRWHFDNCKLKKEIPEEIDKMS